MVSPNQTNCSFFHSLSNLTSINFLASQVLVETQKRKQEISTMSDLRPQGYHDAIFLLSLLKQLDQAHLQNTDHQTKCAYDVDHEDHSAWTLSLNPHPRGAAHHPASRQTSVQRGRLLNALSFIASVDASGQSVTAMTMEEVDNGSAVRFRIAMDQNVPQVIMDRLRQVGKLLVQAATEGRHARRKFESYNYFCNYAYILTTYIHKIEYRCT